MRRIGRVGRVTAPLLCAAVAGGCQLVNGIDVCDRGPGVEQQINGRTDQDQALQNTRAFAPLATGKAMVAFTSELDATGISTEIRGGIVSSTGVTLGTCGALAEQTWAPPRGDPAAPARYRIRPTLGRPLDNDGYVLLAYNAGEVSVDPTFQLFVQVIDPGGCPLGGPVQVSNEPAGVSVTQIQVVPTARREFTLIWGAIGSDTTTLGVQPLHARAVKIQLLEDQPIVFLPTAGSLAGDIVDLPGTDTYVSAVAAGERGDGGVLLAWIEAGLDARRVHLTSMNSVLEVEADQVVTSTDGAAAPVDRIGIDVASDGAQALVAWTERDMADPMKRARVVARFYTPSELLGLRAPQAPDGEPFRLGSSSAATDEGYPVLARAPEGGFIALWNESGDPSHPDASGAGVRALLIGSDGGRQFANLACDRSDFQLNTGVTKDQIHPTGVFLADGTLLAGWTDLGGNGTDRGADTLGSGVRAVSLPPRLLRPLP